jgi:hypothetical protein
LWGFLVFLWDFGASSGRGDGGDLFGLDLISEGRQGSRGIDLASEYRVVGQVNPMRGKVNADQIHQRYFGYGWAGIHTGIIPTFLVVVLKWPGGRWS